MKRLKVVEFQNPGGPYGWVCQVKKGVCRRTHPGMCVDELKEYISYDDKKPLFAHISFSMPKDQSAYHIVRFWDNWEFGPDEVDTWESPWSPKIDRLLTLVAGRMPDGSRRTNVYVRFEQ